MSSGPPPPHEFASLSAHYARIDDAPMDIDRDPMESESLSSMSERFSNASTSDQSSFYDAPEPPSNSLRPPQAPLSGSRLTESTPLYTTHRVTGFPSSTSEFETLHPLGYTAAISAAQRETEFASSSFPSYPTQAEYPPYFGPAADAPPSYSKIVMEKPMCVVCEKRPAFVKGGHAYSTCGNTCRRRLEQDTSFPGQKGFSRASDQARAMGTVSEEHGYGRPWSSSSSKYGVHIKMCEVCKTRPQYQKGGKTYPTCGLTCAAKLTRILEKCDMCKTKPKQIVDGRMSPYCGQGCKANADMAASSSSVCDTCIMCWRAHVERPFNLFCSEECNRASMLTTSLAEIPRGHVVFRNINEMLVNKWKETRPPCPQIKRIYKINITEPCQAMYSAYKTRVENQLRSKFSTLIGKTEKNLSNEKMRFLGLRRQCGFGDTGNVEPCATHTCLLCSIVRMNVRMNEFPHGVTSTGMIERAAETAMDKRQPNALKFILVANIIHGTEAEVLKHEDHKLPPGAHSLVTYSRFGVVGVCCAHCPVGVTIKLMRYRSTFNMRASSYLEETIVFDEAAISPLFLVSLV